MSGESDRLPSSWTVDTLHQHFITQIEDLKRFADERYAVQQKNLDNALAAADRRFESVNQVSRALNEQVRDFPSRAEVNSEIKALENRVADLVARVSAIEERRVVGKDIRAEAKSSTQIALSVITTITAIIVVGLAIYGALRP